MYKYLNKVQYIKFVNILLFSNTSTTSYQLQSTCCNLPTASYLLEPTWLPVATYSATSHLYLFTLECIYKKITKAKQMQQLFAYAMCSQQVKNNAYVTCV